MAIILQDASRPALDLATLGDEAALRGAAGSWGDRLAAARPLLAWAAQGVGKVVPEDPASPSFIGTGFVVAPRLAVTAAFVADALLARTDPGYGGPIGWLDLADGAVEETRRVQIAEVQMVHPNWRFAFLVLGEALPAESALALAGPEMRDRLSDRHVCAIGYPSRDARLPAAVVEQLFRNRFGTKRLMPGQLHGFATFDEFAPTIRHDATTASGTSGAPLLDLESGLVVGMHFAGQHFVANHAAPAWEFNRDPQWRWLWAGASGGRKAPPPPPPSPAPPTQAPPRVVFPSRRLLELQRLLVDHELHRNVSLLLQGLPRGLQAEMEELPAPQQSLLAALARLNRTLVLAEGELPMETMLNFAEAQSYALRESGGLRPFLEEAKRARLALAAAGGSG